MTATRPRGRITAGWTAAAAVLAAPALLLFTAATVLNPAASTSCAAGAALPVVAVPEMLTASTAAGQPVTLDAVQLGHAATIATVGSLTDGVDADGVVTALMAALTESRMRMLANTSAYPDSAGYPNDGDGSDHDSLGLFQMRPQAGWGTVAELMNPLYQARAFYGGPGGPNGGSPRGLLDLPDLDGLTLAEAAQAVEVSAHPDRYATWEPVARTILAALTGYTPASVAPAAAAAAVVVPLPAGSYVVTSPFGSRDDPLRPGTQRLHEGVDLAAPDGTPILAVAAGRVEHAGPSPSGANRVVIAHVIAGEVVASVYRHMWDHGIHVAPGEAVAAGQHIADVGSQGRSTGPHLHLEIRPGGATQPPVDPQAWLTRHDAALLDTPTLHAAGCARPGLVAGQPHAATAATTTPGAARRASGRSRPPAKPSVRLRSRPGDRQGVRGGGCVVRCAVAGA